jgi:hypothetical protein
LQNKKRMKICWDTRWHSWLRHYVTSRKIAGSIPDDVIGFFQLAQFLQPHSGVDSASNRNAYQGIFLDVKGRSARKTDNIIAICEPIV